MQQKLKFYCISSMALQYPEQDCQGLLLLPLHQCLHLHLLQHLLQLHRLEAVVCLQYALQTYVLGQG